MKIKKLFGSNRDDSDLWYELGQSKPDKAARRYFDTYIQADQVQRERMDRSLQQYDYINNKAFKSELADLWRNYSENNK